MEINKIKERKERRDKDGVCRVGLQIKSCRECLFDAFCTLEDNKKKNEGTTNQEGTGDDN